MMQHELSFIAGENAKWYRHDPVTVLLGIYPVYLKSYVHTPKKKNKTNNMQMFIAFLFIIIKNWKSFDR